MSVRVSVVVPTFNRTEGLLRLLRQLCAQNLPRQSYEVIVVDDGSATPVSSAIESDAALRGVTVERQKNAGAARARHTGALRARGELLLFVDDDMQVGEDFLAQHLAMHEGKEQLVVLGRIARDPAVRMPLFERWHATMIEKLATAAKSGSTQLRGTHLFSGNASMRAEDYFAAGGFDEAFGHSEDVELGLRLEKLGCQFALADDAVSLHGSDHSRLDKWLGRAFLYGRYDHRIARRHPELAHANPWQRMQTLHPMTRAALIVSIVAPGLAERCARAGMAVCELLSRYGNERAALLGTSAAFSMQYYRGVREELGSLGAAVADARAALAK